MIVNINAWTILDGSLLIKVAIGQQDALGVDSPPIHWQTFTDNVGRADLRDPRDLVAYLAESLMDMAAASRF